MSSVWTPRFVQPATTRPGFNIEAWQTHHAPQAPAHAQDIVTFAGVEPAEKQEAPATSPATYYFDAEAFNAYYDIVSGRRS